MTRNESLTDDDLDELKGCVDLGFGFSYVEIPKLFYTLPALQLCCSMSQKFNHELLVVGRSDQTAFDSQKWPINARTNRERERESAPSANQG